MTRFRDWPLWGIVENGRPLHSPCGSRPSDTASDLLLYAHIPDRRGRPASAPASPTKKTSVRHLWAISPRPYAKQRYTAREGWEADRALGRTQSTGSIPANRRGDG